MDLVKRLPVAALFDGAHQKVLRGDKGKVFENGFPDDLLVDVKPIGHVAH